MEKKDIPAYMREQKRIKYNGIEYAVADTCIIRINRKDNTFGYSVQLKDLNAKNSYLWANMNDIEG